MPAEQLAILPKSEFSDMDLIQASPFLGQLLGSGQWRPGSFEADEARPETPAREFAKFRKKIGQAALDTEKALDLLRELRIRILLDLTRADLEGRVKPTQIRDLLKNLGETLLFGASVIAEKGLSQKFVHPLTLERMNATAPQVICSLSRLGSGEPFYTTLPAPIFIHSRAAEFSPALKERDLAKARRSRKEWLPAREYFLRQVNRIMAYLRPPEVSMNDFSLMREDFLSAGPPLLPGPLVIKFSALEGHFLNEHPPEQALNLLRLRALVGPKPMAAAVEGLAGQILRTAADLMGHRLKKAVETWFRARAAAAGAPMTPGGLLDIEKTIRILQLKHAADNPNLVTPSPMQALGRLADAGLIEAEQRLVLSRSYNWQWVVTNRLCLFGRRYELTPANLRSGAIDSIACLEGASAKTLGLMKTAQMVIGDLSERHK